MIPVIACLAIFAAGLTVGQWWNPLGPPPAEREPAVSREPASMPAGRGTTRGRGGAGIRAVSNERGALSRDALARAVRDPELTRGLRLAVHQISLDRSAPGLTGTEPGRALAESLRELRAAEGSPEKLAAARIAFRGLFADPARGLATVRAGLASLPDEGFALERLSLLEAANSLHGSVPDEEIKAIAADEMINGVVPARMDANTATTEDELNKALSTTLDMAVPQAAHQVYLSVAQDPQEALSDTVKAIEAQPDPAIQAGLARQFVDHYPETPEMQSALQAELNAREIALVVPPAGEPQNPVDAPSATPAPAEPAAETQQPSGEPVETQEDQDE